MKASLTRTSLPTTPQTAASHARVIRTGAFGRGAAIESLHLLSQTLFRDAVVRERHRAERFEEAFVLVLISLTRAAPQSRWTHLVEALSHSNLDADVIGWFTDGSVVGLLRSIGGHDSQDTAATLADTIRRELVRGVTAEGVDGCSIRLEVYSPKGDGAPPLLFDGDDAPRNRRHVVRDAAKRAMDILGSVMFFIVFWPVFILVSILVKLTSKGPALYRQERVGQGGRPFTMLKFRTMQVNADPRIHRQYVERFIHSSRAPHGKNAIFKIVDDPRVTPLGQILRRTSLDEIPQFWNVLKGDMSLVGPRPPLPYEVAEYKRWHRRRLLEAKPGITGLWQVNGRSRTTFDEMVRLDLRYAKRFSVWMDLKILFATPRAVLSGRGAH